MAVNVDTSVGIKPARATSELIYSAFLCLFADSSDVQLPIPAATENDDSHFVYFLSFSLSYEEINIYPRCNKAAHFRLNIN